MGLNCMAKRFSTVLGSRTAKIRKAIFYGGQKKDAEIRALLAGQGANATLPVIRTTRWRMEKQGIPVNKIAKTSVAREFLKQNSHLANKEVEKALSSYGVSNQNVRDARHHLGQSAPRGQRAKRFPKLDAHQYALVKESLPILKRLVFLKTVRLGKSGQYAEEAFLELSSKLPHWVAKKRPDAKLESFLDFKTKLALRDFGVKTIMQGSGLKQKEVRDGLKWLAMIRKGKSAGSIAKKSGASAKKVRGVTDALQAYFGTIGGFR